MFSQPVTISGFKALPVSFWGTGTAYFYAGNEEFQTG